MSSRSDTSYPVVSVLCAPTLESTFSLISNVPCRLEVMGTRGNCFSEKSCFWDSNKDNAVSGNSRELIVRFSSRSFTLETTESGPMSNFRCVPLLQTVNSFVLIVKGRVVNWREV